MILRIRIQIWMDRMHSRLGIHCCNGKSSTVQSLYYAFCDCVWQLDINGPENFIDISFHCNCTHNWPLCGWKQKNQFADAHSSGDGQWMSTNEIHTIHCTDTCTAVSLFHSLCQCFARLVLFHSTQTVKVNRTDERNTTQNFVISAVSPYFEWGKNKIK